MLKEKPLLLLPPGLQEVCENVGDMLGKTRLEKQDQDGRAIPACQFFLIPRLQKQLELLLTLLSSESKSPHKDVCFFQVHSFLAAIFAALSDLLPWRDDISVLSFTEAFLTGCVAPCKHPQL